MVRLWSKYKERILKTEGVELRAIKVEWSIEEEVLWWGGSIEIKFWWWNYDAEWKDIRVGGIVEDGCRIKWNG